MHAQKMEKYETIQLLLTFKWIFIFVFCTGFGVLANESFLILKNPGHKKWHNIFLKLYVAVFVCILVHGVYTFKGWDPNFEYIPLLLASFLHQQVILWLRYTFWPMVSKLIVHSLTQGKHDDE